MKPQIRYWENMQSKVVRGSTLFIATLLALLVGIIIGMSLSLLMKGKMYLAIPQDPPIMTNAQYGRVLNGYVRDHATHQWFKLYTAEHDDGCKISGTAIDITFTNCRHPLTGGIPDITD